ncbi:interleukin 17-like protein [Mytilus trossulus]|uniref:interleukin 17-like protein n=1 Tax=Mytilus trossulus TaxID=6551 RepID=UPI003007DC3E
MDTRIIFQIFLTLIDMLFLFVLPSEGRSLHVRHCQQPDDIEEAFNNLRNQLDLTVLSNTESTEIIPCPSQTLSHHGDPQRLRSTCPWIWEANTDNTRYPQKIYNARCICRKCIGSSTKYHCESIFTRVKVFRILNCVNGLLRYVQDEQRVSVGCTCAHKRTHHNS